MKINFSFRWPTWLLPRWLLNDLERRTALTGTASREWSDRHRIASVQVVAERKDEA